MKKGCFVQLIIVITILTAAIVYIIKNHFNEFILEPGKKALTGIMMSEFDEKMAFVKSSPEKDSFKVLLNNYMLFKIDTEKEISSESIQSFLDSVNFAFRDSVIDTTELNEIKKIAWSIK